jgi:hypothetical protein
MTAVWTDPDFDDEGRRAAIYRGDLIVYSPVEASLELVEFTRSQLIEAFDGLDPRAAQHHLPVEKYAAVLAEAKPRFIHHPRSKELLRRMLQELGCSPTETYFDVPRLRTSTSDGYLTTGIAYAFHPHRDTWYSAPMCQINWWMPVYGLRPDNCMAFHPRYWDEPVRNSSDIYNYQEWNARSRFAAADQIHKDTRPQPRALQTVERRPDVRILPKVGGVILFSAAQLHSSVENTSGETRVSVDFRTVHAGDVASLTGARNVDSRCTGSTMGDYLRVSDLQHLPDSLTAPYAAGPPQRAPDERMAREG